MTRSRPPVSRPIVVLILGLALSGVAQAGVFRCKTPTGATVFQDSECQPGSETGQKPRSEAGEAVDKTQPLEKRFKNPGDKPRLEAAMKIIGLQIAIKATIEHCQKHAPTHAAELQGQFDTWRNQHAIAIQTSDQLVEKYTAMAERVTAYTEVGDLMQRALSIQNSMDPARSAANCQAAPSKLQSFLSNRFANVYATVEKTR